MGDRHRLSQKDPYGINQLRPGFNPLEYNQMTPSRLLHQFILPLCPSSSSSSSLHRPFHRLSIKLSIGASINDIDVATAIDGSHRT
jgi:hypothetical protein